MWQKTDLAPGLYLVATPIGAARDITLRALDVLASAEVLAAEDTRTLRHLMEIHGVPLGGRPLLPYHDHNGPQMRPRLLAALAEGRSVAYASEAGTPLVADPGFALARAAIAAGHAPVAVPGASAVLAALAVAGLPTDRFLFAGFPPPARAARRRALTELGAVPATLVFYESPRRVGDLLADMVQCWGETRQAVICRELTKRHEEVLRGSLGELSARLVGGAPRGEVVVLVDRAAPAAAAPAELEAALAEALAAMSVREAAETVSKALGMPRREVYQAALRLAGKE
jgi:16S rRNA (cytidine1402-2'-O)-methyltransferase